ncbi:hypothetical protein [Leptospira kobayashii]|nr:hypothetical protein [Leptospira kobayashii]
MNHPNQSHLSRFHEKGLSFLIWMSPMFSLGIFFALGVLFAFPKAVRLKRKALFVIFIHLLSWIFFYPIELLHRSSLEWESRINEFLSLESNVNLIKACVFLIVGSFLFLNYIHSSSRQNARDKKRNLLLQNTSPGSILRTEKRVRDSKFDYFLLVLFLSLFLTFAFSLLIEWIHPKSAYNPILPLANLYMFFFNYLLSCGILLLGFNRNKIPSILSSSFIKYERGIRFRESWKDAANKSEKFPFLKEIEVKKRALFRDRLVPGWGHIYLEDFWRGFPFLFVTLLLWLFLAVWTFSFISPVFGLQFLGGMGLKPGIPDKSFFLAAQNIAYSILTLSALLFIYFYSNQLLTRSFSLENLGLKNPGEKELDPVFEPGIRRGFRNTLPMSLLFHLILICLVFIIPISLQRNQQKKDKSSDKKNHFQPEKMEFYFIDPNIPDEMDGLNGGVVTGTDTNNKTQGEKISDEKAADNGPKAGYVKKIRGKKIPPTYSNYISAKMRIPESYMDYWAKAPHPYSSVVAYTITQEGDIVDVELVEGSDYPDQDLRTLQLVESLGPLIPPPNSKNDIRVTELFWNGPIDPEFVPTPLQKEMINMFDGRYMEELPE